MGVCTRVRAGLVEISVPPRFVVRPPSFCVRCRLFGVLLDWVGLFLSSPDLVFGFLAVRCRVLSFALGVLPSLRPILLSVRLSFLSLALEECVVQFLRCCWRFSFLDRRRNSTHAL